MAGNAHSVATCRIEAPAADEQLQHPVLRVVRVLVLIDEHVAEGALVALAHLLEQLEQVDRAEQQVVEVHRVHPQHVALVQFVDVREHLLERRADGLAQVRRGAQAVLRGRDLVVQRRGRVALRVDADGVGAALGQPPRVGLVVDRELARVAEPLGLDTQDPRARGMERHQPHPARAPAEQPFDTAGHLLRRLVRERDREDLVRLCLVGVDQVRDAVRQHARLAAARAGEDQQRPLAVRNRLALGLVEAFEQRLEVLCVGVCGHVRSIGAGPAGRRSQSGAVPAVCRPSDGLVSGELSLH